MGYSSNLMAAILQFEKKYLIGVILLNDSLYRHVAIVGVFLTKQISRCLNIRIFNRKVLFIWNFYSLQVDSRWRNPQLEVSEHYPDLTNIRQVLSLTCSTF